jgi:hypothetical protein
MNPKFLLLALIICQTIFSQEAKNDQLPLKINYKELIIPSVLIGYGLIILRAMQLNLNTEIKEEVTENIDHKITIDDFTQYLPAATVYGLNAMGIKVK